MSKLQDCIRQSLEPVLELPDPRPRLSAYHDMPYALCRYDPGDELELRQEVRLPRQRTTDRSGAFDLTSGPGGPAVFQRQDGIGRRLLGKGRRVRRVIPAWRGQRTATNQMGAARHGRHGAHCRSGRPLLYSGKPTFARAVFPAPVTNHWRSPRPCLKVVVRP